MKARAEFLHEDDTPLPSGFAKPGCSADHIVHGCAGDVCGIGQLYDQQLAEAQAVLDAKARAAEQRRRFS